MVNVLADLAIESEAATATALRLARAYDEEDNALRRFATAVLKYWVCKRATPHAAEALECLGGNGYVEESPMPRLLRDAPLNGIWEGSGNVMSLDVLRALAREPEGLPAFLAECELARGGDARLDAHLDSLARAARTSGARGAASRTSRWRSRRRCWCGTRRRPSPTRSAPGGSVRRAGGCSGRCPPAWTARRSWSGPWPRELRLGRERDEAGVVSLPLIARQTDAMWSTLGSLRAKLTTRPTPRLPTQPQLKFSVQRADQLRQLAPLRHRAGPIDLPQHAATRDQR